MAKKDGSKVDADAETTQHVEYEKALTRYQAALEMLHKGDFGNAKSEFDAIADEIHDEPVLTERCRTYAAVCGRRLAPGAPPPANSDEYYHRGVVLTNDGRFDDAIRMFDESLKTNPGSAKVFYGRSTAWALKGKVDAAIGDLRQAIAIDPPVRFQATNDPDFDSIREEPAFIDIIEPTPSGV